LTSVGRTMKPRLCLFTDSHEPSGVGTVMLTLARALQNQYQVLFVCPPTPCGEALLEQVHRLGMAIFPLDVGDEAAGYAHLSRCLETTGVHVFHAHAGISWEGHAGIRAACAAAVPIV